MRTLYTFCTSPERPAPLVLSYLWVHHSNPQRLNGAAALQSSQSTKRTGNAREEDDARLHLGDACVAGRAGAVRGVPRVGGEVLAVLRLNIVADPLRAVGFGRDPEANPRSARGEHERACGDDPSSQPCRLIAQVS